MNKFKQFFKLIRNNKLDFTLSVLSAIIYSGSMVGISYLVGLIINESNDSIFSRLVIVLISLIVISFFSLLSLKLLGNKIAYSIENNLRNEYLQVIENTELIDLDKHSSGYYVNNVITNILNITDALQVTISEAISGFIMIILTIVLMGIMNLNIMIFVILVSPLSILTAKLITKYSYRWNKDVVEYKNGFVSKSVENINNHEVITDYKANEYINNEFKNESYELSRLSKKAIYISSLVNPTTRLISSILYAGVLLLSVISVMNNSNGILYGEILTLLALVTNYTKPFNEITNILSEIQTGFASYDKLLELNNVRFEHNGTIKINSIDSIEFKNVSFGYNKPLFEDFNLQMSSGSKIAIVGHTGSGKTTLVNLLMRFYNVSSGSILINGIDIKDIDINSFREMIGMVLQDPWIKESSLRENLTLGKDISDEEIDEALKQCYLTEFVDSLDDGINSIVRNDESISKGYKQLINIARVMLKSSSLVILDEATSNLDTLTEKHIHESMDKVMKEKTSIVIAHRLKTIENSDLIIVMKKGKIVEIGTHKELLEKQGYYTELYLSK